MKYPSDWRQAVCRRRRSNPSCRRCGSTKGGKADPADENIQMVHFILLFHTYIKHKVVVIGNYIGQVLHGLEWMFANFVLQNGKVGVMRVVTSQWGLTRSLSIFFSLGIVRDIVPHVILLLKIKIKWWHLDGAKGALVRGLCNNLISYFQKRLGEKIHFTQHISVMS